MKIERRWMWIAGILAAAGLALAAGVPLGTLLIVGALLACPVAMRLGMRGHQSQAGSTGGMSQGGGMACCPPDTQPGEHRSTSSAAPKQASPESALSEELTRRA